MKITEPDLLDVNSEIDNGTSIESRESLDVEEVSRKVFDTFLVQTRMVDQRLNRSNNALLRTRAMQITESKSAEFWRFVCLPNCSLDIDALDWTVNTNNPRYNTLTRAVPFDVEVVKSMREIGINSSVTLVINDLEAPLIRIMDPETGSNPFKALTIENQRKVIQNLSKVRKVTRDWVRQKTTDTGMNYPILFFSDFIDSQSFLDGVDEISLNLGANVSGAIRAEMDFIKRADPGKTPVATERIARARVSQYAYEGMLLADKFTNGIFLASEYPVIPVWKKLTIAADIPTLFYVEDSQIKNI